MSHLLPIDLLFETDNLAAFLHPQPDYPIHILIIPKRAIRGLSEIQESDQPFLNDLFRCVRVLVNRFGLETYGYRLIANGGSYQDVPLLHFHLISRDEPADGKKTISFHEAGKSPIPYPHTNNPHP